MTCIFCKIVDLLEKVGRCACGTLASYLKDLSMRLENYTCSVMCQLPTGTNYRKSRANYRHIVYVWSTDKFTERGRAISGRSIEAYPPVFDFARFLDSEALSKAIYHSLGCN